MSFAMTHETEKRSPRLGIQNNTGEGESNGAVPALPRQAARCLRCGYQWFPRAQNPVQCARCRSKWWNQERTYQIEGKPDPTRKPRPRGVSYDSQSGAQAASLRFSKEDLKEANESPPDAAPSGAPETAG